MNCEPTQLKDFDDRLSMTESDKVYTPLKTTKRIIEIFKPRGKLLEPCKGSGNFLKFMPNADWCEIEEGKDFFDYNKKVDWIITNTPYSKFTQFLIKSFSLSTNVVFLVPLVKPFRSFGTIKLINDYGGIVSIHFLKAKDCGFSFGYPFGVFHFKRDYKGPTTITPFTFKAGY